LLTLKAICREGQVQKVAATNNCLAGEKVGLAVQAKIGWSERGKTRQLTEEEWLYDWK
jgi:hypothetical protein